MASRLKKSGDKQALDLLTSYKKVRKDWGGVNPRTIVEKNQKKYNRRKENQKWRKELDASV